MRPRHCAKDAISAFLNFKSDGGGQTSSKCLQITVGQSQGGAGGG